LTTGTGFQLAWHCCMDARKYVCTPQIVARLRLEKQNKVEFPEGTRQQAIFHPAGSHHEKFHCLKVI
jgi:hypothetical protein